MPVKLFVQLRLLNPALLVTCFPPMKLGPSISSSASFSRIFPFKLKYRCFLQNDQIGIRRFSTPPVRSRTEFSRGGGGGARGEVRTSKSLIEDKAELSDWVSDLASDSFRGGDESDGERGVRVRARTRDGGRDWNSTKRSRSSRRESSDSEEFNDSNWRAPAESFSRNSRISKRFDSRNDDDDGGDFSPRRKSSRFHDSKFGLNSSIGKRGGRDMESGNNRNRGSGLRKDSRKQFRLMDEEDDGNEDGGKSKFGVVDLLSDEESDVDEEDGEKFCNVSQKENAKGPLFGFEKQVNEKGSVTASIGKSKS